MWSEELPDNCPPEDSYNPEGEPFYRLVVGKPVVPEDFHSPYKIKPTRFKEPTCEDRALSIFKEVDECVEVIKSSVFFRKHRAVRVTLNVDCGVILLDDPIKGHYNWWLYNEYNPCEGLIEEL